MVKRLVGTIAVGIFVVAGGDDASAFSEPIPTTVSLLKWGGNPPVGKLYKIVSKAGATFPVPAPGSVTSGSFLVTVGSKTLTCDLTKATWKGLGSPPGSKGWKYVNTAAPGNDLCKVVLIKEKVIKVLAKGVGNIDLPLAFGNPDVSLQLSVGADSYCALATGPHNTEKKDTMIKMLGEPAPATCAADCDCSGRTRLSFTTGIPAPGETAGTLSNWRCSNAGTDACADDTDCPGGTCEQQIGAGLPMDLKSGAGYTGGGFTVWLQPFLVPDGGKFVMSVSGAGALTLGPTTPAEVGQRQCTQGRTCSNNPAQHCVLNAECGAGTCLDNCLYGPPLPLPASIEAVSLCAVRVVGEDASGTAQCDGGEADLTLPLRWVLYMNGDLFGAVDPPNIPGTQPCPICDRLCQGSDPAERFPCDSDQDCTDAGNTTNLTCDSSTKCLGGPNDGGPCAPGTSDSTALGDSENAFPTSHDCPSDAANDVTVNIGALRTELNVTTGSRTIDAVDLPGQNRVFCGFCRDGDDTLCFEGEPFPLCPDSPQCNPSGGATLPGCRIAVPCQDDGDCSQPYESCQQHSSGAFAKTNSTRIEVAGSTEGQCINDGQPHTASLVGFFCIPLTFDRVLDGGIDFPGPGVELLSGDAQLQ